MNRCAARRRLRDALPLLLLLIGAPLAAQVPPRDTVRAEPDTLRVDTLPLPQREPGDTARAAADERQLVTFPVMQLGPAAGIAAGEWVWDRAALLREAPTSLIDLLRRIPGVPTWRAGVFAQPEAAAAFGGTAGRVEVEIDGFILDPLAGSTYDLAQLPIVQIRELRVERRLGLLRIRVFTDQPEQTVPFTRIEAGLGQPPPGNLFRGIFLAPHVGVGPFGAAIERLDTEGTDRAEPATVFSGWAKWSWTDGRRGAQIELLRTTLERAGASPWPVDRSRQDVVLRLRNSFTSFLAAEVYAGRSVLEEAALAPDTTGIERNTTQAGFRATLELPEVRLAAGARYRDAAFLPRLELHARADGGAGPVRVGGELSRAEWPGVDPTLYYGAHAELGLVLGASAFGEVTGGRRGAPPPPVLVLLADTLPAPEPASVLTERTGWRAGFALQLGRRAAGSISYVSMEQDVARPFGLPFDTAGLPAAPGRARGIEAYGRLVIVPGWLAIESWINDWQESEGWTYLPPRSWRTALELHALPLPTGNLEILGRLEGTQRGSSLVYSPSRTGLEPDDPAITTIPAQIVYHAYLQIRVIDVRIFVRWEDLTAQTIEELPGRVVRGQRLFYGVKWNLWN